MLPSNRREFLQVAGAAAAAAAIPYHFSAARAYAAKDRPILGCIGTGSRWGAVGPAAMNFADCVAVCDVDAKHAEAGAAKVKSQQGKSPEVYEDYRKLLERKDIDVVTIVTPDHWHTKIAIEAMKAGKDVYCEKPLTLTIDEGKQIIKVLKETKRVFQVGTQQRSEMNANGKNTEGTASYLQGNYQAAIQSFQQALANDPRNADAYYNLAATYHQIGKQANSQQYFQQAEVAYNQCLDLAPDHVDCHRGLAVLLAETDRKEKAFTLLRNWATTSPASADARVELARLYEEYGDKETARRHLEESVAVNKNNPRAWLALGRLREDNGDYAQALDNYRRSYSLNQSQPQLASRIGVLERNLGVPATPIVAAPGAAPTPPSGTRVVKQEAPTFPRR